MRRRTFMSVTAAAAAGLATTTGTAHAAPLSSPASGPQRYFHPQRTPIDGKLGVNEWGEKYNFNKFNWAATKYNFEYDLATAKQIPMSYMRLGTILYDDLEGPGGLYNFWNLDYAVTRCQQEGYRVILPIWFVSDGLADKQNIDYERELARLKALIHNLTLHFRGRHLIYEAVDEALTTGHFWLDQDDSRIPDVIRINEYFAREVRTNDPTARFMAGDFAWILDAATNDKYYSAIAQGYLDHGSMGSYHPYMNTGKPGEEKPEDMIDSSRDAKMIGTILRKRLALSGTEFGYPFSTTDPSFGKYTREQQRDYTTRQVLVMDAMGFECIVPFTAENGDTTWAIQQPYGTVEGPKAPVMNPHGTELRHVMSQLSGYAFHRRVRTDPDDYVFAYRRATPGAQRNRHNPPARGGLEKLVFWTVGDAHTVHVNGRNLRLTSTPEVLS